MATFYDFTLLDIRHKKVDLSYYKHKVILVVNVASQCGFTPQYKELEALYQKYKEQGFVILAIPTNQFKNQEPEDDASILNFCTMNYGVSFPLFAKADVNGKNTLPLYTFLKKEKKGILGSEAIKWNFTKFLINKEGEVIKRFAPSTSPLACEESIKKLL